LFGHKKENDFMNRNAVKKTVFVTGGSRGIGKAITMKFAEHGFNVCFTYNSNEKEARSTLSSLESLGVSAKAIQANFLEAQAIERTFAEFDRYFNQLDILINNAGWTRYVSHQDLDALTEETFDKIITVDLKSVFSCIKHSVKRMTGNSGCIINITSTAAYNGIGSNIAYCAAKAGVTSMTKSFARSLGPRIRVNAVAPGLTETEMTFSGPTSYRDEQISITPQGRIALPEDISDAVFSLANDMKFVNGKTIIVDGGLLL